MARGLGGRAFPSPRLASWCGVAGPVVFTLAWVAAGAAWTGYDPRWQYISELAAYGAPLGVPMVGAFLALAALTLVFVAGLRRALGGGASAPAAAALLGTFGLATVASGLARCDPGCGGASLSNQLHTIVTYGGLGALTLATLVTPQALPGDGWRGYRLYSRLTGLLAAAIFLRGFAAFGGIGLGQRLFVSLLLGWLAITAARSPRLGRASPQDRPGGVIR